jgi:hypothetical protein
VVRARYLTTMDFRQIKTQCIELQVTTANTTQTNFTFDQQQFLVQKQIISIETFSADDLPFSPLGNILPTLANLKQCYADFYGANPEDPDAKGYWLEKVPLITLHRTVNGSDAYVRDLYTQMPRNLVWEKTKIYLVGGSPGAPLGNASALSFVFQVGYQGNLGD